jgi:sarcosine oxidase subunit beta
MKHSADVVIVGAGIIGLSIAWQITRRSQLSVMVIEKGTAVAEGSTGASSAVCRHRYTHTDTVVLARDGIDAYRHWRQFTGLTQPRASFQQEGVLWLPADEQWAVREHERMQTLGIVTEVLDDSELAQRFPAINNCRTTADYEAASEHQCHGGSRHLLEVEGGYIDPVLAAEDLLQSCRDAGVRVTFNAQVEQIESRAGQVCGVRLANGESIAAGCVVSAAGPWCNDLLAELGVCQQWQLEPTRIQIIYLDRPTDVPGHIPVTLDMSNGIYFRTQNRGQQLVLGSAWEQDEQEVVSDPDNFDVNPDDAFRQRVLHALHHRLPQLPYRGQVRGHCGLYTINRQDMHPLVGATELTGLYLANGFSGHGFKLAPAIGSLLARQITGEAADFDTVASASFLAPGREPIELAQLSVLA